jgi:hypothetical protein
MTRRRKHKTKRRPPPYKRIPQDHGKLTSTARQLYDLIFSLGLGGCWMSNATLAYKLDTCTRSAQRARQLLVKRQLILTARTNPHTWIMWARYHPALKHAQILLYPDAQQMDNPYYEIPESTPSKPRPTIPAGGSRWVPEEYWQDPPLLNGVTKSPTKG